MQQLEAGDASAFQTGKAARQKEREEAQEFKAKLKLGVTGMVESGDGVTVKVDDKYKFMAAVDSSNSGAADDAWDD